MFGVDKYFDVVAAMDKHLAAGHALVDYTDFPVEGLWDKVVEVLT